MSINQLIKEICENRTENNMFDVEVVTAIYVLMIDRHGSQVALDYCRDYMLFRDLNKIRKQECYQ